MSQIIDLTDWVVLEKYHLSKIRDKVKGAKVTRPYPGARIWSTMIDDGGYLVVTWVPTSMGPLNQTPEELIEEDA